MDKKSIYLNTAGTGLLSSEAIQTAKNFLDQAAINPSLAFHEWMEKDLPELRKDTARLLETNEENISFLPNFSFALGAVLQSLNGKGKKVLLYDMDYPSLNMPFEVGDFDCYYIQDEDGFHLSTAAILQKIKQQKIDIVALSHVQFLTGYKVDIESIGKYCQEKGVLFIVDATQSMGALPLNFDKLPVDVMIGSSYKWLNGGMGSAILCTKKDFLEKYPPEIAGFGSLDQSDDKHWKYSPSNRSFEPGHMNATGLLQLHQGIRQKIKIGVAQIAQHNTDLIHDLHAGLLSSPFEIIGENDLENRLHILIFKAPKNSAEDLQKAGFVLTWRKNTIRISPHFYNTKEDIQLFLKALKGDHLKQH